jgi:hypothetical protein
MIARGIFYRCLRNNIVTKAMIANMMNIKKMIFATLAATAKAPVNPIMAAMIAIARKINAHANIIFLLYLNWFKS